MQFTDTLRENHAQARERIEDLEFGAYVGGETRPAASGETFAPRDPAVDEPIADVSRGAAADIDAAVEAAETAAHGEWGDLSVAERSNRIRAWVDRLRDNVEELTLLETLEVGKPLTHARADVENGLDFFEYYASVALAQEGEYVPTGDDTHAYVRKEPYGVTGQILPWNYPVLLMGWKVGAALAAGNTSVCKPAEQAPLAVIRAAQLSEGILPDGVLNVVPGFGEEAGEPLTVHDGVRKLSFTGSVPVGKSVMRAAADSVTPVTLELGGKNPFVVLPDADVEEAAVTAATGGLYNAGQSCDSASRVIVHEAVESEFMEHYLAAYDDWEPSDPLSEGATMGPLAFERHHETVSEYVDVARAEGATVRRGGGRPTDGELDAGWYYRPTVVDDVTPEMRVAQEEVFGPVQFVLTVDSYEEAIEVANGVDYGLAAGVATGDPSMAHRAAADVEAGSVWVNQYFGTVPGTPFGGFKQSGVGRECARQALDEHVRTKSVNLALDDPPY